MMRVQQDKQKEYAWWRAALRGEKQDVQESYPQCGFYRRRWPNKEGDYYPAAIFWKDGTLVCAFRGDLVDPIEQWTWLAKKPIDEHIYRSRIETGKWPDGAQSDEAPKSNMPDDPFERLKGEVDDKMENARRWLKDHPKGATSEIEANYARNLQQMLSKLKTSADPMFKAEKDPWFQGGKAVDDKYRFREDLAALAGQLEKNGWA